MDQSEAREMLERLLDCWLPRCVEGVGFHQNYDRVWNPGPDEGKFLVFQSRITWVAATCAERFAERRSELEKVACHGLDCLISKFRDKRHGGFFWLDLPGQAGPKRLYGLAFALFAISAVARSLNDQGARELAVETFSWIDEHLHDKVHGGYFEICGISGEPLISSEAELEGPGSPEWKSLNTQMHMFEALLELRRIYPDPIVTARIDELVPVFRDRMFAEPGLLHNRFKLDWTPASDQWEIGHDLEAAYLLLLAGKENAMAKALIGHAVENGFDHDRGGFYESRSLDGSVDARKGWWTQMEGLNALVLGYELLEDKSVLDKHWSWVRDRQWDQTYGGFFGMLSESGEVLDDRKGYMWKAAYHDSRALLNAMSVSKPG